MINNWSINSRIFASWQIKKIYGTKGLGFYLLVFPVEINIHAQPETDTITVTNFSSTLSLTENTNHSIPHRIGRLTPQDGFNSLSSFSHTTDKRINFEVELDAKRIEAIEQIRLGGSLNFSIQLYATATQGKQSELLNGQSYSLTVSQSDWIQILENIGYRKTLLLEVPLPMGETNSAFKDAAKHLDHAHKQMLHGHYRDAVGACRDAIESLNLSLKDEVASLPKNKRERSKADRVNALRQSFYELTNAAKHADEVTESIDWNLADARACISFAATLLQLAAEELKIE